MIFDLAKEYRHRSALLSDANSLAGRQDLIVLSKIGSPLIRQAMAMESAFKDSLSREPSSKLEASKRAVEFLGDVLSWITGVPSAEDHRLVLEQNKLLKLDDVNLRQNLEKQTSINEQLLKSIHIHEGAISNMAENQIKIEKAQMEQAGVSIRTLLATLLTAEVNSHCNDIWNDIRSIDHIMTASNNGRLSPAVIPPQNLTKLIDQIYLAHKLTAPVFHRESNFYYYRLPLAHTWVSDDQNSLVTLLQVPIAPVMEQNTLVILSPLNKINQNLELAVLNQKGNYFRYLSSADLRECHDIQPALLCAKRPIEIVPAHGCSLRMQNCDVWATNVVHDVTNTEIILQLENEINATLDCDDQPKKVIELPLRSVIDLSTHCKLSSNMFVIEKLHYRHLLDFNRTIFKESPISIFTDEAKLTQKLNLNLKQVSLKERENLGNLFRNNDELKQKLQQDEKDSNTLWQNISTGRTSVEQIILWCVIGVCMAISIISISIHFKLACQKHLQMKRGGGQVEARTGMSAEDQAALRDVNHRLREVETKLRMMNCKPNKSTKLAIEKTTDLDAID